MTGAETHAEERGPIRLAVVVPCFNEEEVLKPATGILLGVLADMEKSGDIDSASTLLIVDDGSTDASWQIIEMLARENPAVRGIKLARNFGHQSAILAGMSACDADAVVTIDADLQDPPQVIADMVRAYRKGAEIVLGVRDDRSTDTVFKRSTAQLYYWLLRLMGVNTVVNHADFRLLGRDALAAIHSFGETQLFLRGIIRLVGFRQELVHYRRGKRQAGQTKYNFPRMLGLALDGITSFTAFPLRLITMLGFVVSVLAFLAGIWAVLSWLIFDNTVPGWTSVVLPMYFLGGIQLLSIGIIGEYLGKNYLESKHRPRFIIEKSISNGQR
jgi:glycosyltransferase involved in cell wall biosynthesis